MCRKMYYKNIKKILSLLFVVGLSCNVIATRAENSSNDGSAFITKAEFDSLKNNFQNQIDNYNTSIDSKIDTAIASYLSGIKMAKEQDISIGSYADKVYCMKSAGSTEAKDMKYVYVRPYVNYDFTGWVAHKETSYQGVYGWHYIFTPNTKLSTGKRLLIKNTIDKSGSFNGTAEWVGYATGVSEMQTWLCNSTYPNGKAGYHSNLNRNTLGMNHSNPIKNTVLNGQNWEIGYQFLGIHGQDTDDGYQLYNDDFKIYLQSVGIDYSSLSNSNLIIWQPETYYCFTESDKTRDFMFDAVDVISGWTESNTSAEIVYKKLSYTGSVAKTTNDLTDFNELFTDCSTANMAWFQDNIYDENKETWREKPAYLKLTSRIHTSKYDYGTNVPSGGSAKKRQPYTTQGFPYYSINDWKQLYISLNDWAAKTDTATSNASLITTPAGDKHLSLNAGWPIVTVSKGSEYTYDVSFDDTGDHLIWGKLQPFTTNNANTESGTVVWDTSVTTAGGFNNAALVGSGKSVSLKFTAANDGILYLKWATKPASGTTCKGGGTLKPSKTIHERLAD